MVKRLSCLPSKQAAGVRLPFSVYDFSFFFAALPITCQIGQAPAFRPVSVSRLLCVPSSLSATAKPLSVMEPSLTISIPARNRIERDDQSRVRCMFVVYRP